jgi:hypothetical protein
MTDQQQLGDESSDDSLLGFDQGASLVDAVGGGHLGFSPGSGFPWARSCIR